MCVGPELALVLAAAGATAGGNYLQTKNNNASNKAQANARNVAAQEGVVQQQKNQTQATDVLNTTLNKFSQTNQQQGLGDVIAQRTNAIQNNTTPAAAPDTNIKSAPTVVQSDLARKMGEVAGYSASQAGALAKMGATGDQFGNNSLALNDSGLKLGTISNFAQGQLGVNRLKQRVDFENARKAPSALGNLLSTAGPLLMAAAGPAGASSGAGAGGTSVTTGAGAAGPGSGIGGFI